MLRTYQSAQTTNWLMSVQIKNLLTRSCKDGSYGHFDIIYVVVAQFVMTQFKMEVV